DARQGPHPVRIRLSGPVDEALPRRGERARPAARGPRRLAVRQRGRVFLQEVGVAMETKPIDADNHYYEPLDAFTSHLDKAFKKRGVRPVQDGKRVELLIGGKLNRFTPTPPFNPIIVPGGLDALFRGQIPEGVNPAEMIKVEPLRPEYRDRDARLAVTEEQG